MCFVGKLFDGNQITTNFYSNIKNLLPYPAIFLFKVQRKENFKILKTIHVSNFDQHEKTVIKTHITKHKIIKFPSLNTTKKLNKSGTSLHEGIFPRLKFEKEQKVFLIKSAETTHINI